MVGSPTPHASLETRRRLSALKTALGIVVLVAIPVFCAVMLSSAWMDGSVLSISRSQGWITRQSEPGWFVASTIAYALVIAFAIVALIAVSHGLRRDRDFIRRGRTAPRIDDAIRIDPDAR